MRMLTESSQMTAELHYLRSNSRHILDSFEIIYTVSVVARGFSELKVPACLPLYRFLKPSNAMQALLGWQKIDPWLIENLLKVVKGPDQQEISLEALIIAMASCLRVAYFPC